jgi:hypothetical protein
MSKHLLRLNVALMVVLIAMWVGGWVPLASAGAKEVKPKAPVPQTGQTLSYADGDDGDLQAGVPWPVPRFTDRGNGTVRDNLTGLIWLKDASCLVGTWADALATVDAFNAGLLDFGCTEYIRGAFADWRLPNVKELQSLIDFGFFSPALSNAAGTAQWTEGNAFLDVRPNLYWSSTTAAGIPDAAWYVDLYDGGTGDIFKGLTTSLNVWPVQRRYAGLERAGATRQGHRD